MLATVEPEGTGSYEWSLSEKNPKTLLNTGSLGQDDREAETPRSIHRKTRRALKSVEIKSVLESRKLAGMGSKTRVDPGGLI